MSRFRTVLGLVTVILTAGAQPLPAAADGISKQMAQDAGDAAVTDPALSQAIREIIADQMAAFRRDDAVAAFNDASPFIQGRFQQPDIFLQMVRSGYAPVYRPHEVEFRDLVAAPGGLEQRVFVMGPDGRAYLAHYQMQRQPDGSWKINGCTLEPLGDQST
jgi:ketosteroid isomerase-like protein